MIVLLAMFRKKTIAFLNASKINYVKPEEWMHKSPDAAPMDYSIWGYLKQRLNKRKIESLNVLKKNFYTSGQRWIKLILIEFWRTGQNEYFLFIKHMAFI